MFTELLTKDGMMDWLLSCTKMVFAMMINILEDFLSNRKQRVILNDQYLFWADIRAGVPWGSILGPLLLSVYINDLSNDLKNKCRLFADETSLFSVVHDIDTSTYDFNNDLEKISEWAFKWKMSDPTKQAQEIIFSR